VGFAAASSNFNQTLFGNVQIFEVIQVFADSFDHVESFAAASQLSQGLQPAGNVFWQS
jgi:hypothetical protein